MLDLNTVFQLQFHALRERIGEHSPTGSNCATESKYIEVILDDRIG